MNDPISLARQTDAKQKIKAASLPLNSDEPTAGIVIGWHDSALQVGPERAGPILAALAESGEGGEGVQDERGEA